MKKRMVILLLMGILLLSSCGTETQVSVNTSADATVETVEPRDYNDNMTFEQYQAITVQLAEYMMSLSESFSTMAGLCEKYADTINSSDKFDWSQYWDFRETKAGIEKTCKEILAFDDSECSSEYQLCWDELKSEAYVTLHYISAISEEKDVAELTLLANQYSDIVAYGMKQVAIYQTEASIAFLEANDGDKALIQELRASITQDDDINSAYSSKSKQFTNQYGTPNTRCAYPGCGNTICTSGDTNCCIIHSARCLNCGKYIDGDALFCIDCLKGNVRSAVVSSNGCKFTYFDGSICGNAVSNGMTLCDYHFNELYRIYNSLVNVIANAT